MASSTVGISAAQTERVVYRKLPLAALVAILGAVLGNLLLRTVAVAVLRPDPAFLALSIGAPIFFSVIGVLGAIIVYAIIGRFSRQPLTLFRRVALVTLIISFIPDVLMVLNPASMPGVTVPNAIVLMLMHVVAWYASVEGLIRFSGEKS